jgi:nickel transport protein
LKNAGLLNKAVWLHAIASIVATLMLTAPAHAHEVISKVAPAQALTITLEYSDGEPFSYELYEVYTKQDKTLIQTGRTDAKGRVTLPLPKRAETVQLRAFSVEGHGIDTVINVPAASADIAAEAAANPATTLSRPIRLLIGLALILAAFFAWHLIINKRRKV